MAIEVKGRYHTSAPTYNVNGQIGYLELDASGNLKVTLESGSINVGAVDIKGTSDGGVTWYGLDVDTSGRLILGPSNQSIGAVTASMTNVSACKLQHGVVNADEVTCTNASQDYASANAIPAGTKYVTVYCPNACIVAVGEITKSASSGARLFDPVIFDPLIFDSGGTEGAVGVYVGAGQPTTFPLAAADVTAAYKMHCQSATAGSVVRFTYMTD